MTDFHEMKQLIKKHKQEKKTEYNQSSKDRLKKIASSKIRTTMIGDLDTIEKTFGFLWGLDEDGHDTGETLSPEQQHMKDLYERVRSRVLDNGNTQIRNLDTEMEQYDITWNRFSMTLPVKPMGE